MPWGEPEISFYNVDSIFDFLLDTGMKPFVELGFMPEAFASGTQTLFHYKANNTPPKDYDQWGDFIKQFGQHLIDRYGKEEVSQWFFEVWNEPNLKFFFSGTRDEYFKLYETTAGRSNRSTPASGSAARPLRSTPGSRPSAPSARNMTSRWISSPPTTIPATTPSRLSA